MINYDKVKTLIDRFDPEAHAARAAQMAMMQQQQGERVWVIGHHWQQACVIVSAINIITSRSWRMVLKHHTFILSTHKCQEDPYVIRSRSVS